MSAIKLVRTGSTNVFRNLEEQLRELDHCGDRIARAAGALRASAKVFATAAARLQRGKSHRLRIVA